MKRQYHIKAGDKYGKLTAVKLSHIGNHNRSYFLFKCECGKEKVILGAGVKSGNTKSCGCLSYEAKLKQRLPNNRGVINHLILQYKRHAKDRGFLFSLSYKRFAYLISLPCYYCGSEPGNNKITKNCSGFLYSGIDRVNNKKNYTVKNTVPCCTICNRAKKDMSLTDFKSWVNKLLAMADQWG